MLKLRQEKHVAARLQLPLEMLKDVAETADEYCQHLLLHDPRHPDSDRDVLNVTGNLRLIQSRLYRRVFLPALAPSSHSHGGIRGRHIKSNLEPHLASTYVFITDISGFYPNITHKRVYQLLQQDLECSPDVSRLLTRLCTNKYHLALGMITSPILADQIMKPVDHRIAGACGSAGLIYTRYVDDISISGEFPLDDSGFVDLVTSILRQNGFKVQKKKHIVGKLSDGIAITKLVVKNGHPDVSEAYLAQLQDQLDDAQRLASGEAPKGLYFTESQIRGRVYFAAWVNPNRRRTLVRRFRSIPWDAVAKNATALGLVACKPRLIRQPTV